MVLWSHELDYSRTWHDAHAGHGEMVVSQVEFTIKFTCRCGHTRRVPGVLRADWDGKAVLCPPSP